MNKYTKIIYQIFGITLFCLTLTSHVCAFDDVQVAGIWETDWGTMHLRQSGSKVEGTYDSDDNGEIVGTIRGDVLKGFWIEDWSSEKCSKPRNGRYHWGKLRITFTGYKMKAMWEHCDREIEAGYEHPFSGKKVKSAHALSPLLAQQNLEGGDAILGVWCLDGGQGICHKYVRTGANRFKSVRTCIPPDSPPVNAHHQLTYKGKNEYSGQQIQPDDQPPIIKIDVKLNGDVIKLYSHNSGRTYTYLKKDGTCRGKKESDPFADEVISWTPGNPTRKEGPCDPSYALGAPNYDEDTTRGDPKSCSLGCGGELVVRFVDNDLVNGDGADLSVYEAPTEESYSVDISTDGANWINLGKSKGGKTDFDIGEKAKKGERFYYVRINDLKSNCKNCCPGADIDSVKALHTSADIPEAASTKPPIEEETEIETTVDEVDTEVSNFAGKWDLTFHEDSSFPSHEDFYEDTSLALFSLEIEQEIVPGQDPERNFASGKFWRDQSDSKNPDSKIIDNTFSYDSFLLDGNVRGKKFFGSWHKKDIGFVKAVTGSFVFNMESDGQKINGYYIHEGERGKEYRPGKRVWSATRRKEVKKNEKPSLEVIIRDMNPAPYAQPPESKLPLHKGNTITLEYFVFNYSKNADFENGTFVISAGDGEIFSLTSEDQKADCPELRTPVKEAKCKIPKLKAGGKFGEDTVIIATVLYNPPEEVIVSVTGSGVSVKDIYKIGADVEPNVYVKFSPDPNVKFITPGTEITAEFTVRNSGEDILDDGELLIYPPNRKVFPEIYVEELSGCKTEWVNVQLEGEEDSEAEMWSEVLESIPSICDLNSFSLKNPARIKATFAKIPEKAVNQHMVIAWELKMPAYAFKPTEQTRGSVAYKIAPEFADLSVRGFEELGESLSGEIKAADLLITNKGSVPQDQVILRIKIDLTKSEDFEKYTNKKLQFPGGKNYLDWYKQPTFTTADGEGKSITLKCPNRPGFFNQFECPLGTLAPGELEIAYINWDQELPAGVMYSYEAWFKENGQGEGNLDGLLADNRVEGSGKVVDVKAKILKDDTECSSQDPNGQITIKSPTDGSEVTRGTNAFGSFDSIPAGMEIWGYSYSPLPKHYWLFPLKKYGETSGTWTISIGMGRPGKADIGYIYRFGVVLADQCTGDVIRKNPSRLYSLPKGVKKMAEIKIKRIGE